MTSALYIDQSMGGVLVGKQKRVLLFHLSFRTGTSFTFHISPLLMLMLVVSTVSYLLVQFLFLVIVLLWIFVYYFVILCCGEVRIFTFFGNMFSTEVGFYV